MCGHCGCSDDAKATVLNLQTGEEAIVAHDPHEHTHADGTRHSHALAHGHDHAAVFDLETRILAKNDALAARNRAWLAGREILALNLMSAPGAGKTTLL